jgi:hypothetical protein
MRINGEKLALLIPKRASEFDGEIVATVHAIRRLLDADGADLHDLARVVAETKIGPVDKPRDRPEHERKCGPAGIIVLAEHLLQTCSWLNSWERGFLESIREQARSKYAFKLSDKQKAKFEALMQKNLELGGA